MKKKIFITSIIAIISISFSCSDNLNSILAKRNKEIPPASINIDSDTGLISIVKGKTHKINAYILPANASDKKLYFASDNEPAASIDKDGLITAHKPGRANITVSTGNNIKKRSYG
ncbi:MULTISPECIES: Ig-like domain-containing protein [unclassified Treponema]|uniref:Ig-like domain-containing protein n=1 Tax=unclassified Treponema TaxID=2638727 RepID=UPI0020A58F53|nr:MULTISPECIES: Ig-like domain-containing protein [unclassified Treponema]UTC66983.1 Ig-like domain-containing protein [Treponema sp. OMZ 789]UTC69713.1 Ig-like domain-containing protein [Treponema sp. OMZ 790]UTC72427.1 Ig-like domain-containing protein [Treponema sp. OMZ 791]